MSEQHPWTSQPGEPSRAYEAFRVYMLLGPKRTLKIAAAQLGKTESLLTNWSAEYKWVDRAVAYDGYLVNAEVDGFAQQVASVRSRHMVITDKLLDRLEKNLDLLKPGQDPSVRWTQALVAATKAQKDCLAMREEKEEGNGILEKLYAKLEQLEAE